MSFLMTADIHGVTNWYDALLEHDSVECVLIGGNLINFHDVSISAREKVSAFIKYAGEMESCERRLIFTSGNHDLDDHELDGGDFTVPFAVSDSQWCQFPSENGFKYVSSYNTVSDIGDLIVVSIPWGSWAGNPEENLISAHMLCIKGVAKSAASGKPLALLYHEPPWISSLIAEMLVEYNPEFLFCGHEHAAHFRNGPFANYRRTKTRIINAGQRFTSTSPIAVELDLPQNEVRWFSEGIKEAPTIYQIPTK